MCIYIYIRRSDLHTCLYSVYVYSDIYIYTCRYTNMCISVVHVLYADVRVYAYVCMYVCMYVSMYVCMYV